MFAVVPPVAAPQLTPPFVDDCQEIVPVYPLNEMVPLFDPAHSEAAPEVVPPTETALTVIVAAVAFAEEQSPFVTFAL